jgi:dipeptidyl aminopeptidase/acylaminoacyl peptidase
LHVFPDEGHGISHVANLIAVYQYTLAFMRRYSRR